MLNKTYQDLNTYLKETFPDIKIDEYRGEFKEKAPANWNPSFPCCLIKLNEYAPQVRAATKEIISFRADFTLFIGEKNSLGFQLIQQIIDVLNIVHFNTQSDLISNALDNYSIEVNSVKFLTAINSVRVHTIDVSIS